MNQISIIVSTPVRSRQSVQYEFDNTVCNQLILGRRMSCRFCVAIIFDEESFFAKESEPNTKLKIYSEYI